LRRTLPKPIQNIIDLRNAKPEADIISYVIGFGHRARSGKDTAAAMIIKDRGIVPKKPWLHPAFDVRAYSFARALKEEVTAAALNAGGMENLWNPEMEFYQENGNFITLPPWVTFDPNAPMDDPLCPLGKQRTLLQWWGTEFRRMVNPEYWVRRLADIIAKEKPQVALVTDMRFPNEKVWVEKHGASVKVERPGLEPLAVAHASELALAPLEDWEWDFVLRNDGTLEQFKERALKLFDTLYVAPDVSR
jgi:hypothetical protein